MNEKVTTNALPIVDNQLPVIQTPMQPQPQPQQQSTHYSYYLDVYGLSTHDVHSLCEQLYGIIGSHSWYTYTSLQHREAVAEHAMYKLGQLTKRQRREETLVNLKEFIITTYFTNQSFHSKQYRSQQIAELNQITL
jgi:hypothetical protein